MGTIYGVTVIDLTLTAATAKTLLQVAAPSDQPIEVVRWGISFGGTAANTPVEVLLTEQTGAGTATASTERQITDRSNARTASGVAQENFTVEPTSDDDPYEAHRLTPNGGLLVVQYLPGERPSVAASDRIAIKAEAVDTLTSLARCFMWWHEG